MKRLLSLASTLVLAGFAFAAAPADAMTYKVAGTFEDDAVLSGSFDFDLDTQLFSDVAVSVSGGSTDLLPSSSSYLHARYIPEDRWIVFSDNLRFIRLNMPDLLGDVAISLATFSAEYLLDASGEEAIAYRQLSGGGSVTPVLTNPSVVPLPAALPLAATALGGLGGLGWLKRRRGASAAA